MNDLMIQNISVYVILAVVALCVCYMFFYDSLKTKDPKKSASDEYQMLYKIAKFIVASFKEEELKGNDIVDKALPHVKNQTQKDGLDFTDTMIKGAINKAVDDVLQDGDAK